MLQDIIAYLKDKNTTIISYDDKKIITSHAIGNEHIQIEGYFKYLEENKLPIFYLCERDSYGAIAHIGWDKTQNIGLFCSGSEDTLSLNYDEPYKVYYEALHKAFELIKPTLCNTDENTKQIMDEYLGHLDWIENKDIPTIIFTGNYEIGVTALKVYKPIDLHGLNSNIVITQDNSLLDEEYCITHNLKTRGILGNSFLLELEKLSLPPIPSDDIKDWWINLLKLQSSVFLEQLQEALQIKRANQFYFVCYIKYESEIFVFCVCCKSDNGKHLAPTSRGLSKNWDVSIRKVVQHTKEFLLPRAGSTLNFQDKKILLVGCGSVGAHISKQLIQSGVGELSLSDPDLFKAENLYRHTLSILSNDYPKSHALKIEARFKYPYTKLHSYTHELMKIPKDILREQSLIIIAIGNPTQERIFNEYMKSENLNIPVIYTWLEGYGLGGHAIFVDEQMSKGCLQCNYIDPSTEEIILYSNMNFLYPNQNITKDIGGCGTLFLPYSHLDSEQTALMVSRMAIDVLNNKLHTSSRISWKGPSDDAIKQNLDLKHRYHRYTLASYEPYQQESCFVCS